MPPRVTPVDFSLRPLVIAHRGYSGAYPENTLIACAAAAAAGAHMLEVDVGLSRDRRAIILHDASLDRTTNGAGAANQMDYAQLRRLDAGAWFDPAFAGVKLPSPGEILRLARRTGLLVNLEIKPEVVEEAARPDGIEAQITTLVRRMRMETRVLISSFDWRALDRVRALAPELRLGLLAEGTLSGFDPATLRERYGAFSVNPEFAQLSRKFVETAHAAGLRVFPWTVNHSSDMERALDLDVDGVFTNYPERLLRLAPEFALRMQEAHSADAREEKHIRAKAQESGRRRQRRRR